MEQILDIQKPTGKIYKDRAIWVGTFLGGPLVAGYLIAENFKAFNEKDKAKKTWIYAIVATVIVFGGVFLIPATIKIPNQIIPLIYTAIAYYLVQHFQGQSIAAHINSGGLLHSWWRTISVGLIGLVITLTPIFGIALLSDTLTNVETTIKTYGVMKHEISFDKDNISDSEVDKLADGLTQMIFFEEGITKYVYVKKVGSDYELSISCNKSVTSNQEIVEGFTYLRQDLQILFPNNKIVFNLVVDSLDNIVKRLE